jgi:antitoxin component of RelBE/YafQ-DinJ toxin-antitoxin module
VAKQSKMSTVSVRIEGELMKRVDTATNIMAISKSDFIRSCLEKLCDNNQLLIDHYGEIPKHINYIRQELAKLPTSVAIVRNGTFKDVNEPTILLLCDELWKSSKPVFDNWLALLEEYHLERENEPDNFEQAKESEGLLGLDTIVMLMAEKSGKVSRVDVSKLLEEGEWIEGVEADRFSLSYACAKAFAEHTAQAIITDYLNKERASKGGAPIRLVIDAKGSLRRSGAFLYFPMDTEEIPKTHKKARR